MAFLSHSVMKLYVVSDLHLEFRPFVPDPEAAKAADVIILAGDIHPGVDGIVWGRKTFPDKPIVYVAGNHEFYGHHWDKLLVRLREAAAQQSVHFLENDSVTIDGVRFLGASLWTDFEYFGLDKRGQSMRAVEGALNDYTSIKASTLQPERVAIILKRYEGKKGPVRWSKKLTAIHTLERHQASRTWLQEELLKGYQGNQGKTVVVTHHYPHKGSTSQHYAEDFVTAGYGSHLPLGMLCRANLWIHGHSHDSWDYRVEDADQSAQSVRVVCNARGYPLSILSQEFENADFDDRLILEV
jgi:hypothetical protein